MAASPSAVRPHFAVFPALAAIFAIGLLCAGEGSAKPPVGDVPGQVVRMDESPISLERRALREALKAEQVALTELRARLAAATDDETRSDLAEAIEARKNSTRLQLLELRIVHARSRGEFASAAKLEARRAKLVKQVGDRLPAPSSDREVARCSAACSPCCCCAA